MADINVVMKDGEIMQQSAPLDLYDDPANQIVAGFIGSPAMNFFAGTVANGRLEMASGLSFALPGYAFGYARQKLICGVRPEQFAIDPNGVAGKVTLVEPTGSELQIPLDFGRQSAVVLLRERHVIKPGDTLVLTSETEKIFSVDASNGHRIRRHDPQPALRAAGAL